ncbi:MAG TPA: hypothetical protein VH539_19265 [Gemmatimonadaceae bacterium]|jgi:hypothetical protein
MIARMNGRLTLVVGIVASLTAAGCDAGCENSILQDIASPDGHRHAIIFERSCGATTDFSTQVSIVPTVRDVNGAGNVFVADTDHERAASDAGGGPAVSARWIDGSTLEIRYDSAARIFRYERRYDDTEIRYVAVRPTSRP